MVFSNLLLDVLVCKESSKQRANTANLIWREPKVKEETGLSKSPRWRLMKAGKFPQKIQLGLRAVGWRAAEVIEWCRNREKAKNGPVKKNPDAEAQLCPTEVATGEKEQVTDQNSQTQ